MYDRCLRELIKSQSWLLRNQRYLSNKEMQNRISFCEKVRHLLSGDIKSPDNNVKNKRIVRTLVKTRSQWEKKLSRKASKIAKSMTTSSRNVSQ